MMDVDALVAIDVHAHVQASVERRGFPDGSPEAAVAEVFGSELLLNVPELAAYYHERRMAAVCFMVDTVRWGGLVTNEEILELAAIGRDAEGQGAVRDGLPALTPERWLEDFEALDIKPQVRPLILKENAARLLGL